MFLQLNNHVSHSFNDHGNAALHILHLTDVFHDFHEQISVLLFLSFVAGVSIGEDIFGIGFQSSIGSQVELFQIFQGSFVLMDEEISVNFDPVIDLDFKTLDEISEINFNPSLFNRGLNFGHFNGNLLEVSYFFIKDIQVGDNFSTIFQKNSLSFDFLFSLNFFNFRLILNQKFIKTFLWIFNPKIAVFAKIFLDIFSILHNHIQVV